MAKGADRTATRAAAKPTKQRALKVYRTAIGFHDAYVAAPSKKAALAAWGTDKDLFARGAAEIVSDPALTGEPLASPGTVIRRTRGSLAEQLQAAASAPPPARRTAKSDAVTQAGDDKPDVEAKPLPKPKPPKPRPSRETLDTAEAALTDARDKAEAGRAALRVEEEALRTRRDAFERSQRETAARLDEAVDKARRDYEAAMKRWRTEA